MIINKKNSTLEIIFNNDLSFETFYSYKDKLLSLNIDSNCNLVEVNLDSIDIIDSSGIALLSSFYKYLTEMNINMRIITKNKRFLHLFKITGFNSIIDY